MPNPNFVDGRDKNHLRPFRLDRLPKDVRLSFDDWTWLHETHGSDTINDYYLNGYAVQGLVLAARVAAGLEAYPDGMERNSEGDTCFLHFDDLNVAVQTAQLAQEMIRDPDKLAAMVAVARENDLED